MLFSKAFLLGFILVLPVGPIAILILQRSLQVGWLAGLSSGFGAAVADSCFAFLATLGLTTLVENLETSRHLVRPIGAMILVVIGIRFILQDPPKLETDEVLSPRYLHHYLWDTVTTCLLTLTNPFTIMAFVALFTGTNLIPEDIKQIQYLEIGGGVFFGSLTWWCLLVFLSHKIKRFASPVLIHRISVFLGLLLIGLAVVSFSTKVGTLIDKWS